MARRAVEDDQLPRNPPPGVAPWRPKATKFPAEIRELLHGKRKQDRYRIIFQVIEHTVYVLYVRHTARDEIEP
jgi:mRNA-degrading endonuclease RelE of RelBE toxin-antitoxin system